MEADPCGAPGVHDRGRPARRGARARKAPALCGAFSSASFFGACPSRPCDTGRAWEPPVGIDCECPHPLEPAHSTLGLYRAGLLFPLLQWRRECSTAPGRLGERDAYSFGSGDPAIVTLLEICAYARDVRFVLDRNFEADSAIKGGSLPHPALAWRAHCDFLVMVKRIDLRKESTVSWSTMDRFKSTACPVRFPEQGDHPFCGKVASFEVCAGVAQCDSSGGLYAYPQLPPVRPASLAPTAYRHHRAYPFRTLMHFYQERIDDLGKD